MGQSIPTFFENSETDDNKNTELQPKRKPVQKSDQERICFGQDISISNIHRVTNTVSLSILVPYLTYGGSLNHLTSSYTIYECIANIISEYTAIRREINKSFEFKIYIDTTTHKVPKSIFTRTILCGCSYNGLVYLVTPVNHHAIKANLYMLDGGYYAPHSKQLTMNKFPTCKVSFDEHRCCVVSHFTHEHANTMIIDGMILVSKRLNIIYGYSMIKGLYIVKKFKPYIQTNENNDPEDNIIDMVVIQKDEKVIRLWRQNLDAFVLTSAFNLFGICVTKQSFKIQKICHFGEMEQLEPSNCSNCWYDETAKSLFVIYKNMENQSVELKIYNADSLVVDDVVIPKEFEECLHNDYLHAKRSFLFYHKPSKSLLLFFARNVVQMVIDFGTKQISTLNIGMFGTFEDIKELNYYFKGIHSEKTSICDQIIGFDEQRSCVILNLNRCKKEVSCLYKFKVCVIRATDFATEWKNII
eukprot:63770_1